MGAIGKKNNYDNYVLIFNFSEDEIKILYTHGLFKWATIPTAPMYICRDDLQIL